MHPFHLKIVSLILKELEEREFENKTEIILERNNIMKALSIGLGIFILTCFRRGRGVSGNL